MSTRKLTNLSKLCVHTITTKPWPIETTIREFSAAGVKGITVWRDALHNRDIPTVARQMKDSGMSVVSLCRGGFFPSSDSSKRKLAIDDNRRAIEEAAALGAPVIVLVCGSAPDQSLEDSRKQIQDGIMSVMDEAAAANIKLAIEPLHPMYADTRSAINTLRQANEMAESINSKNVGIAADVYHLWWDPDLKKEIERCAANKHLYAFHICDWSVPTKDFLNDRGLMGDGCIPINKIRGWVEDAGFNGFNEVEIFSNHWWAQDQSFFLKKIIEAYKNKS